ncbi:MAG: SurA N-terminal domain-containing protein [Thermoleophilia bacterium]|nr:SurA N-terminal domain-containing protein [Thermoleophilia bacterium]
MWPIEGRRLTCGPSSSRYSVIYCTSGPEKLRERRERFQDQPLRASDPITNARRVRFSVFKKLLVIGAVVTFALVVWGCGGELPKGAVAQVGETVITQEQFDQRVADITAQLQGQAPDKEQDPEGYKLFEQRILDYMVTLEIVTQKQAELGVNITDEDLQTQLDQIKQMFGGTRPSSRTRSSSRRSRSTS